LITSAKGRNGGVPPAAAGGGVAGRAPALPDAATGAPPAFAAGVTLAAAEGVEVGGVDVVAQAASAALAAIASDERTKVERSAAPVSNMSIEVSD
jgi:hypothetical protein